MRKKCNIKSRYNSSPHDEVTNIYNNDKLSSKNSRDKIATDTKKKYLVTSLATFCTAFIVAYIASAGFMSPADSDAATDVNIDVRDGSYYINVTSLGKVNIPLKTTQDGTSASGNDTVTVETNTKGYRLYLSSTTNTENSNRLYLEGDNTSEYYLSPTSNTNGDLTMNSWGFSADGGNSYSPVPIKGEETVVADNWDALTAGIDVTRTHTVTYGAKANLAIPAGAYKNTVRYSVVAEANTASNVASVYPNEIERENSGTLTLTVTIPMMTNMDYGNWTVKLTNTTDNSITADCTSPTTSKVDNKLNIACTVPKNLDKGYYTVTATSSKYGTYIATNALRYYKENIFSITTMQDMTPNICAKTKTPSATATSYDTDGSHSDSDAYIPQTTLTDTRDNKKYVIQKMPDGKCWMVQNLALDGGQTLTSEKTNISSDYYLPNTSDFNSNTTAHVKSGSHTDGSLTSNGNWYSFEAATAGTGHTVTGDGDNAPEDICPKKWRLPSGGASPSSNEFNILYVKYDNKSKFDSLWHSVFPRYLNGGYYDNGYWWSRTSKNDSSVYSLYSERDASSGYTYPIYAFGRSYGISVRCIAQQ